MTNRLVSGLAIWALIVGCCLASNDKPTPVARSESTQLSQPMPAKAPMHPRPEAGAPVNREMQGFAHHARVNMILYPGQFGQRDSAGARRELDAVALALKSAGR